MDPFNTVAQALTECCDAKPVQEYGLVANLRAKQLRLRSQLEEVDAAIAALDAQPEIKKVIELITRAARH